MKRLLLSLSFILIASVSFAQGVTGDWFGLLTLPNGKLTIVFHITKTGDEFKATMDSPDQNVTGLPMDKVSFTDNLITISFAASQIVYKGTFLPDSNKVNGIFEQGGKKLQLNLTHDKALVKKVVKSSRPQDPKDFPYKQEEVVFTNPKAGNQLAGTLTLPANGKATKIAILITGSGPEDRNEEVVQFNHRPFLVLSDWLTRNGIAVLRYDDRGIGKSTGDFKGATTADFADDTEAGVNFIKSRSDLKSLSIGLIGHSEGGLIAPIVASRNKDVKFVVLLAGPGVPCVELMLTQREDYMRSSGVPDSVTTQSQAIFAKVYDFTVTHKTLPASTLKPMIDSAFYKYSNLYSKSAIDSANNKKGAAIMAATLVDPWFRYFLGCVPADYLSKLRCPVLALNGTVDTQVSAKSNLPAIKTALTKSGNKHFEIVPMTGLNHLFQKAVTGNLDEYAKIEETINPAVLVKVSTWINQL